MNKVLMSRSVISKQQSANVLQRSQLTFSRLQCIMYDWVKISSGLAGRPRTHARNHNKKSMTWKNNMHSKHISINILFWSSDEGQSPSRTQKSRGSTTVWRNRFRRFLVSDRVRIGWGGLSLCHIDVVRTKWFHLFLHQNPTKLSKSRKPFTHRLQMAPRVPPATPSAKKPLSFTVISPGFIILPADLKMHSAVISGYWLHF